MTVSFDQHVRRDRDVARGRGGVTLIELLLVLAVITTLAALSWPRLTSVLKQQSLEGNVEQVRQILDHARVRAINEGITLQALFEPNGQCYVLLPQAPATLLNNPQPDNRAQAPSETTSGVVRRDPYRVYKLSEDCRFHVNNPLGADVPMTRLGDEWLGHLENAHLARDVVWLPPILYFPDGSATDGEITVIDKESRQVRITVRGLTGAVTTSPIIRQGEG